MWRCHWGSRGVRWGKCQISGIRPDSDVIGTLSNPYLFRGRANAEISISYPGIPLGRTIQILSGAGCMINASHAPIWDPIFTRDKTGTAAYSGPHCAYQTSQLDRRAFVLAVWWDPRSGQLRLIPPSALVHLWIRQEKFPRHMILADKQAGWWHKPRNVDKQRCARPTASCHSRLLPLHRPSLLTWTLPSVEILL
jgi:hypothetical protein